MDQRLGAPAWLASRRKLALLEADLHALGVATHRTAAIDVGFIDDAAAAWGSLYVMEGASLGGQVISRALRAADWAPAGGLAYFNPYGARTGTLWADFRRRLAAAAADLDPDTMAHAAQATFAAVGAAVAAFAEAAEVRPSSRTSG